MHRVAPPDLTAVVFCVPGVPPKDSTRWHSRKRVRIRRVRNTHASAGSSRLAARRSEFTATSNLVPLEVQSLRPEPMNENGTRSTDTQCTLVPARILELTNLTYLHRKYRSPSLKWHQGMDDRPDPVALVEVAWHNARQTLFWHSLTRTRDCLISSS